MKNKCMNLITAVLAALMVMGAVFPAAAQDEQIRAKIGIQILSGRDMSRARSREMVNPGDRIRIYVQPLESTYVYVIYSDGKTASLLNMTMQKIQESVLYLPSDRAYYKVDGISPMERFTIICSPGELPRVSSMDDAGMSHDKWAAIEKELIVKSRLGITQEPESRIEIAGNVRGGDELESRELFVGSLPIFSGKGLLVRKYEFKVEK